MKARAMVYRGEAKVKTKLHDLDPTLDADELRDAVSYGVSEGHRCTPTEPQSARGWIRWAKIVGAIREALVAKGWSLNDQGNYATVVNPPRTIAIVVSSGDFNTGQEGKTIPEPQCRNPKGERIRQAVQRNRGQLQLADYEPSFKRFPEPDDADDLEDLAKHTWVFLYVEDEEAEELRAELSLPNEMSGENISGWQERIILEPHPATRPPTLRKAEEEGEPIDVPVERRGA